MFSKVLRTSIRTRNVQGGILRYKTTSTETISVSEGKTQEKKESRKPFRRGTQDMYDIIQAEYTELTPLFDKFATQLQKDLEGNYLRDVNLIPIGNILLSKIISIKKANKLEVADHILFERVIKNLIDSKAIHGTHFIRYLKALLKDKKYSKALNSYVDNLQYFKDHPRALESTKKTEEGSKTFNVKSDLQNLGVAAYILSLKESNGKIDEAFLKLITEDAGVKTFNFIEYLKFVGLPKDDIEFINSQLRDLSDRSFDINSESHLRFISSLSQNNLLLKLESLCDKSLKKYAGKESSIKPETLILYMKAFNNAKHPSKVMELWTWGQKNGVIGSKPSIGFWNQLLLSQLNTNVQGRENNLKSIWALINNESKPNSESYSIYIKTLLKLGKYSEIMSLLTKIKSQHPELWDSELKCGMIQTLAKSKKLNEALSLFNVYLKEDGFKANSETYNVLFNGLVQRNKLDEASKLLEQMSHNKDVEPDIATWTTIVNYLLKLSKEAELSESEIMSHLLKIMATMKESGIQVNNVTVIMVLTNLLKNKETYNTGLQLLIDLEQRGIKLNDVGYTGLVTAFASSGAMEDALEYYHKAIASGISPRANFYNSILKGYYMHPNVKATKAFYEREILKVASSKKPQAQPNAYSYYFMISEGIRDQNNEFVQFVIDELCKRPDLLLGQQLPKILNALKDKGYNLSDELIKKLAV